MFFFGLYAQKSDEVYMFSYFINNGEDGLHLAWSADGLMWKSLNNNQSFLAPKVGKDKLMRDPCIISGPDGKFHMVWTVSWGEKGIGYASSEDLINWSEQKYIPVMEHEPTARNCWAPEVFYDISSKQYIIFWSTTIPGRFPETETAGDDNYNHRMYYVTTKDFQEFSETKLFYDQGFNVIDGTLVKEKNEYVLFLKDETRTPAEKNIRVATGKTLTGTYSKASEPITGNYWAEGPTPVKIGKYWVVYFDKYIDHNMGAVRSPDLKNWEDISGKIEFPEGTRHGTVFKTSKKILEKLK
jgi:sucrose-6-phosphate hydrolase SacC (GH32 family)